MSGVAGNSLRQFLVQKDNGQYWNMMYTSAGVRWEPADRAFDNADPDPSALSPLAGGVSPVQIIGSVIDAASHVAIWWEARQQRLFSEAAHEESRRIPWLADMITRWGEAHREGDHLDLRVSEYLAREAREAMESVVGNKRVSIPQSILYELNMIQDSLGSFRSLAVMQFEALIRNEEIGLAEAVRKVLPHSTLNIDFIRSLGEDPASDWAGRVRAKASGDFDRELGEVSRHPDAFISRLFPSNELAIPDLPVEPQQRSVVKRVIDLAGSALPRIRPEDFKQDSSERRDTFRELSLLPAEVTRVKLLHSAWLATNAIIANAAGRPVQVQISPGSVSMGLATGESRLQLSPGRDEVGADHSSVKQIPLMEA